MLNRRFVPLVLVLLSAFALGLALPGCRRNSSQSQSASPDTWATVDGRSITRDDVERAFRRTQDPAATLSPEETMTIKLGILNEMIIQDILLAKARALKIELPQSE